MIDCNTIFSRLFKPVPRPAFEQAANPYYTGGSFPSSLSMELVDSDVPRSGVRPLLKSANGLARSVQQIVRLLYFNLFDKREPVPLLRGNSVNDTALIWLWQISLF